MLTLPKLFWIIYYIIIFLTLISGVINWIRQRYSALAAITIIFSLLVPIVSFVYVVGRAEGMNELQYILAQFKGRDPWDLFIIAGHFYLFVWWFFFLSSFSYRKVNQALGKLAVVLGEWFKPIFAHKEKREDKQVDKERRRQ